eukprot:GEMP01142453.1.p1 GENE.GEMP01142453.1~~GEMP01142453.1.p1  ORF type:complete len:104 (+),score=11.43 GEMP01142453.1:93-404(+)
MSSFAAPNSRSVANIRVYFSHYRMFTFVAFFIFIVLSFLPFALCLLRFPAHLPPYTACTRLLSWSTVPRALRENKSVLPCPGTCSAAIFTGMRTPASSQMANL